MSPLKCWAVDKVQCGGNVRAVDPFDQESSYKCEGCQKVIRKEDIKKLETELTEGLEQCYNRIDTEALEQLLNERTGLLEEK